MEPRKLTKREYLGEGYIHYFKNNETGEMKYVPCTEQEYVKMGQPGGAQFNPSLDGHTWEGSGGGSIKVDTPDTMLHEGDYTIKDGKVYTVLAEGNSMVEKYKTIDQEKVLKADGDIDVIKFEAEVSKTKEVEKIKI